MMNSEEFERKMAFIVNQQAKVEIDIGKLFEAQLLTEQKLQEANDVVTRLAYVTNEGFKDVNAKINALVNSQIRTDDQIRSLKDSQKETDEKFRKVLDRLDRRSDNGSNTD